MKDKRLLKKSYAGVIRNIYKKLTVAVIGAMLCVILLRNLVRGYLGDFITKCICFFHNIDDWEYASFLYYKNVRIYYATIIVCVGILFFLIIFRIVLNGFTKYFDEILLGIDVLSNDDAQEIQMSKEIDFVANKLQAVKNELNRRKQEKEDAEKRKDELIVYLAHDIKTPLTSVIGYISLLNENPNMKQDEREKYTRVAFDKAIRLEGLINEFFEITRSHAQTILLEKSRIDLSYLIEQVVDETYPILSKNNKHVEVSLGEQTFIEVDAQRMARVFTNLLKNACNYSEGDKIKISTVDEEGQIHIVFENEGNIPKEHLEHLFDKFYRVDEARQTKTGGAGLGLAISKEIVAAHQGTIIAECKNGIFSMIVTLPKSK